MGGSPVVSSAGPKQGDKRETAMTEIKMFNADRIGLLDGSTEFVVINHLRRV